MELCDFKPDLAMSITSQTLVGVNMDKYPIRHGNCFSVMTEKYYHIVEKYSGNSRAKEYFKYMHKDWRIVNFYAENLEKLIKDKIITWPVKILVRRGRGRRIALIHDERIPDEWYADRWCEACCPEELLPLTQRLRLERMTARGDRKVVTMSNGMKLVSMKLESKSRKLPDGFKFNVKLDMVNLMGIDVQAEMENIILEEMVRETKTRK